MKKILVLAAAAALTPLAACQKVEEAPAPAETATPVPTDVVEVPADENAADRNVDSRDAAPTSKK